MHKKNQLIHLKEKIALYKQQDAKLSYSHRHEINPYTVCIELVASVIAGIVVGALLDHLMKTKLIFKIICLLFSVIAGFYSIYKLSRQK